MELNLSKWQNRLRQLNAVESLPANTLPFKRLGIYVRSGDAITVYSRRGSVTFTPDAKMVTDGGLKGSALDTDPRYITTCLALFIQGYQLTILLDIVEGVNEGDVVAKRAYDGFLDLMTFAVDSFKLNYNVETTKD